MGSFLDCRCAGGLFDPTARFLPVRLLLPRGRDGLLYQRTLSPDNFRECLHLFLVCCRSSFWNELFRQGSGAHLCHPQAIVGHEPALRAAAWLQCRRSSRRLVDPPRERSVRSGRGRKTGRSRRILAAECSDAGGCDRVLDRRAGHSAGNPGRGAGASGASCRFAVDLRVRAAQARERSRDNINLFDTFRDMLQRIQP